MTVSIKDIAKACKVNPATISRALNGQKGVSEELRLKIIKVAKKLGYSKNPLAASLITRKSGIIGLVIPDITNPYYAKVAKGITKVLEAHGYVIFLCDCDRNRKLEQKYFEMLCNYRVEGAIVISVTAAEKDLKIFFDHDIKVVCADNPISKKISSILNDNYQGAYDLTVHLIQNCKVKRLAAVMGNAVTATTQQRLLGCKDALKFLNAENSLVKVVNIVPTYEEAIAAAPDVLSANPDCIFAVNDTVALALVSYCLKRGIKVPEDIKIAGYDDIDEASMISVPLTTVHQRKKLLGQKAASQLLSELAEEHSIPVKIELLPKLMVRESCGEKL